jgi:hypothetical protein
MTRENEVKPSNFIYPLFVHTKDYNEEIASMPGCLRHTTDSVMREVGEALAEGVSNVILFPKIPDDVKTNSADECYNPKGLVPELISRIKSQYGSSVNVWTDVALDPYSDQGHDGMVSSDTRGDGGKARILNDETVEQLCRHRIGAIRDALDSEGFTDVSIVAYTAKYASAFYGAPPPPRGPAIVRARAASCRARWRVDASAADAARQHETRHVKSELAFSETCAFRPPPPTPTGCPSLPPPGPTPLTARRRRRPVPRRAGLGAARVVGGAAQQEDVPDGPRQLARGPHRGPARRRRGRRHAHGERPPAPPPPPPPTNTHHTTHEHAHWPGPGSVPTGVASHQVDPISRPPAHAPAPGAQGLRARD